MSSLWEQRAARNEALFRAVNDNIAELEERHGSVTDELLMVCECADDACTQRLTVDPGTYKRVRQQPRHFLVIPGHERPEIERVIETHGAYFIVEKTGPAGDVAEQTQS